MSLKNRDNHNRWRNKTVAFRVSPEEDAQIETFVKLSGLTKQDYITRRLTGKDVGARRSWWIALHNSNWLVVVTLGSTFVLVPRARARTCSR